MAKDAKKPAVNPAKLKLADAAKLLSKAGGKALSAKTLKAQIEAGAPTNADGTLHLVHYTAWLASQVS